MPTVSAYVELKVIEGKSVNLTIPGKMDTTNLRKIEWKFGRTVRMTYDFEASPMTCHPTNTSRNRTVCDTVTFSLRLRSVHKTDSGNYSAEAYAQNASKHNVAEYWIDVLGKDIKSFNVCDFITQCDSDKGSALPEHQAHSHQHQESTSSLVFNTHLL